MPLPLIFLPPTVPLPLVEGFGIAIGERFDFVPMRQGEGRKRRMFTTAPRTVSVAWLLNEQQMLAFDAWGESDLDCYSRRFTIQLKRLGEGLEFWGAEWIDTPACDPIASPDRLWRVSGSLLLTGEPADALPSTGELVGVTVISLGGRGTLVVPNALSGVTIVSLGTLLPLSGVTEVILSVPASAPDGGNIERLWARMAPTPIRSAYIDDSVQEQLQRAWMEINHGIY